MSSLTTHLIRRGIDEFQTRAKTSTIASTEIIHIPVWGQLLLVATVLVFCYGVFAVDYTYGTLVATLAAVEAPSTTAIIRTSAEEEGPDAPLLDLDQKEDSKTATTTVADHEILLIKQRPLTSRFCAIRRHLRARGGRWARFRGLKLHILYQFFLNTGVMALSSLLNASLFSTFMYEIAITTLLTRLSLLWTHTVISEPSTRSMLQRMPRKSMVVKALGPTAVATIISKISAIPSIYVLVATSQLRSNAGTREENLEALCQMTALWLFSLVCVLGIQIPIDIAITRVRASLLPEEESPIIPFDRSFSGHVVPESEGGKGVLGLWQAWVGCDMATRFRVLGVYLKTFAMEVGLMVMGMLVVLAELRYFLGPAFAERIGGAALMAMNNL